METNNYTLFMSYLQKNILSFLLLIVIGKVLGQPVLPIMHKGERPAINLNNIPAAAFYPDKIHVKFLPAYRNNCQQVARGISENRIFNIPQVDALNKLYSVKGISTLFKEQQYSKGSNGEISTNNLLQSLIPSKELQQVALIKKHQSWGFDLWFEISFQSNVDIKQVLIAYKQTKVFEVVEPLYYAKVIGCEQHHPQVQHNPPPPFITNDPLFGLQWNLHNTGQIGGTPGKDIDMMNAWGITTGDTDVIVSVHDIAMNVNHPDLAQNMAKGKSFNFVDNKDSLTYDDSHGSHCGGIIAEVNNNKEGLSGIAGGNGSVNSGARLISCEIFGPKETFGGFPQSMVYAADNGAAISSNSWGEARIADVYQVEDLDAIDYFIANGGGKVLHGGVVVFASGNDSSNRRIYPGGYSPVICVAATNNQDKKSFYSDYGSWVDISAPGGEGWWGAGIFAADNENYSNSSGTSFACPHVAGVAALVASVLKGKASANDVRDILLSTTDNHYPLNQNFKGLLGTGRLNAYSAVLKAQALASKRGSPIKTFSATSNCNAINLQWNDTLGGEVIIAYNNEENIGVLSDGNNYTVGDVLIGGGRVIYKGKDNQFAFSLIDSVEEYHFKIWGILGNNLYSFSRNVETFEKPLIKTTGENALVQNFDFPPLYPTRIWSVSDTNYDFSSWIHTANDTAQTGAGDDYSMCLYNYKHNKVLGAVDTLSGPYLQVKGADSIALSYWHAYQFCNKNLSYSDTLEVLVSANCGKTFTSLWKKGGKELATVPDTANKEFYPFGGLSKWKENNINLSQFKWADKILIAFRGYNGEGNNLFLDNIKISVYQKTDVGVCSIEQPVGTQCEGSISPQILLKNTGINTISSCNIGYQVDGGIINRFPVLVNIPTNDSLVLNLPAQDLKQGTHTLKVFSYLPNNTTDNNTLNDTLQSTITLLPIVKLPFTESFEDSISLSNGWQKNNLHEFSWLVTDSASSKGKASVFVQNFRNYYLGETNDLISPPLNINNPFDSMFLLFDVAATYLSNNRGYDTLQVDITKDCGISWQTIYKKWGEMLQTTPSITSEFIPTASQWRTDSLNLIKIVNKGDLVSFRFRNTNNNGNNIYLDNLRCYNKYNLLQDKGFLMYPNPFKNTIAIQHYFTPTTLQSIVIYNEMGQRIKEVHYYGLATTYETVNVSNLPPGLYAIQLIYTDKQLTKKMLK